MTDHIYVRNGALERVGELVDFQTLNATLRFNAASNWTLQLPFATPLYDALTAWGAGIQIERDGQVLLSGPIDHHERRWSVNEDALYLAGWDDTIVLRDRLASPVPSATTNYSGAAYDVRTGDAGTVMGDYVNVNAGPGARSDRRTAGLTIAPPPSVGVPVTGRARFQSLESLLQDLATASDTGFRVVQSGTTLQFQVYLPADRSGLARFAPELGNLESFVYTANVPDGNYGVVMGGGEGTLRVFVEGGDTFAITTYGRRIEFARDRRDTTDTGEMTQTLGQELADRVGKRSLTFQPIDTPNLRYGVNYALGDIVSVIVDGVAVADVVREVNWTLTRDDGSRTRPTIGTPDATNADDIFATLEQQRMALHSRVRQLERVL